MLYTDIHLDDCIGVGLGVVFPCWEREDNYLGFFNLISVHITGQGSSSFSFMNCEPCADDKVMYLSGFPWSYLDVCKLCQCCTKVKKYQALGIVSSTQCKKTCWLVNLSSCNECLFSIIFEPFAAGRVGIAGYCMYLFGWQWFIFTHWFCNKLLFIVS